MIKCIIFDLDGPLISSKIWHYESLNIALDYYGCDIISLEDHIAIYDGLSTRKKLDLLTINGRLNKSLHTDIWNKKQEITEEIISNSVKYDKNLVDLFIKLKSDGFLLFLATNSIKKTTETIIRQLGIIDFFDKVFTNEDVYSPKPSPEIYLRCIIESRCKPKECLVIEDSPHGIEAAFSSGANVMQVKDNLDITEKNIYNTIYKFNKNQMNNKFESNTLNVLLLCAGAGSRFQKAGYSFIKPLIEINGKPMIQVVTESLKIKANYIFCFQREHYEKYNLKYLLNTIAPDCKVVLVDSLTDGAARTALLASEHINNDNELIIANSDQYIEWDSINFFYHMRNRNADGGILTFHNTDRKWSYVKINKENQILEVAEKRPISDHATCLSYNALITTREYGKIPIGKIVNNKLPCSVASLHKGEIKYKKVINFIKNDGTKSKWKTLSHIGGRPNRVIVTDDHQILTNKGWIEVGKISNELIFTDTPGLNSLQSQLLDGCMLGDMSISSCKRNGNINNSGFKCSHSIQQEEWVNLKLNSFTQFNPVKYYSKNFDGKNYHKCVSFYTKSFPCIYNQWKRWYINGKKRIPKDLKFSPLLLAAWYMDDGNLTQDTARFSTNCFSHREIEYLQELFKNIGIQTFIVKGDGERIVISAKSKNIFWDMIHRFIPESMMYKLPERYRKKYCKSLWSSIGKVSENYYTQVIIKDYVPVDKYNTLFSYCLEVEDSHNFLINNMVFHNCGIYYYKKGSDFVKYANQMIQKDIRVNNEFYLCPVYNEFIQDGKKILPYKVDKMIGCGTPEDLENLINYFYAKQ